MHPWIADNWRETLTAANLSDFDAFWALEESWFEPVNQWRGGWSGVSRHTVPGPDGLDTGLFVKRQQNYQSRSLRHPVRGEPTLAREFRNLLTFRQAGIHTPEPVFFAQRWREGKPEAILVTRELSGYHSLEDYLQHPERTGATTAALRRDAVRLFAAWVRNIHAARLQHNCLYPKHVLLGAGFPQARSANGTGSEICLIDLEKAKRRLFRNTAMYRDLDTLNRHCLPARRTERLRFLLAYLGQNRMTPVVRRTWHKLGNMAHSKHTTR